MAQDGKVDQRRAAPFGLSWGMSKSEVELLGVNLSLDPSATSGVAASARNLPKVLGDTGTVYLFLGFDDRLWRIWVASTEWDDDDYGIQAKARFEELVALLSERYGQGEQAIHSPSDEFYQNPENFAYSLSQNKRFHGTTWKIKDISIELFLQSKHTDTYYVLSYEYRPLADAVRKGVKEREKEAL